MTGGEWQEATERVRSSILSKFGTLAAFARRVEMEPTQLSATLRPHRRPEPETLDRFSSALGWEPSRLREWYGYVLPPDTGMVAVPVPPTEGDRPFDPALIVRFVESKPDEVFQAALAQERRYAASVILPPPPY